MGATVSKIAKIVEEAAGLLALPDNQFDVLTEDSVWVLFANEEDFVIVKYYQDNDWLVLEYDLGEVKGEVREKVATFFALFNYDAGNLCGVRAAFGLENHAVLVGDLRAVNVDPQTLAGLVEVLFRQGPDFQNLINSDPAEFSNFEADAPGHDLIRV